MDVVARVDAAIGDVETDPKAMEAVQALVEMYGEGLARIVERVDPTVFLDDELVAHLLVLHDLHPIPLEERVRGVLPDGVELVSIENGVVRLRGTCTEPIEDLIRGMAPDVEEIVPEDTEIVLQIQVAGQERLS